MLEVTPKTLRKWEATGYLVPVRKNPGGTRYYSDTSAMTCLPFAMPEYPAMIRRQTWTGSTLSLRATALPKAGGR